MNPAVLIDCAVLVAYFAIILGIGLSQRSKSDSVEGFALGDRQTPWWAVLASILAAEISAATFLGAPESGYKNGNWTYGQFAIGTILARIIVSYFFIPLFYRHGVVSLYEYLGTRFGAGSRSWASMTFLVTRVLAMGTRLYVSAIILVLAWQLAVGRPVDPWEKFWIFAAAVVLVTVLTAIYTTAGGIRAVIWTDFIQVGVLVVALGFSVWFLIAKLPGGWGTLGATVQEPYFFDLAKPKQPEFTTWEWIKNILTSEYTIWAAFIGSTFVTMATHGIDQDTVQRMLTAKNRRESAKATILSGIVDLPVVGCFILVGILVSAFYKTAVLPPGIVPREAFPYFILTEMPVGVRGLVVAGIMATAMGSLSTALNAMGTSFARDFVLPRREARGPVSEAERVRVMRWSTVLFAGFIIFVGVGTAGYMAFNPNAAIIPLVLGILGFTFGSLLALFLVAMTTKTRGNDTGNIIAMIAGFLAVVFFSNGDLQKWVGFTSQNAKGETVGALVLAFPWRVTLGTLATYLVAICFRTPSKTEASQ